MSSLDKVKCPHCGYKMPIIIGPKASCKDLWVKCKGRGCKAVFEVKVSTK